MGIETIGKQIATLRKERGIKQEELAKHVGVSTQAVSKWENGGVPDTELLPMIADFFSVSVDSLFGRNITDYSDLRKALMKKIFETAPEERMKAVFNYCWDMERVLYGGAPKDGYGSVEDFAKGFDKKSQTYSSIMTNEGFTRMGIANRLQYFLLVPETQDTEAAFFEGIDYPAFFADFSDEAVFNACVFLHKRPSEKAFTPNLLVKNLGVDVDKAIAIIAILQKYCLIHQTKIEMDDEIQVVYKFQPTPSFIAFLVFAREMIDPPDHFNYYHGGRSTSKPYLK